MTAGSSSQETIPRRSSPKRFRPDRSRARRNCGLGAVPFLELQRVKADTVPPGTVVQFQGKVAHGPVDPIVEEANRQPAHMRSAADSAAGSSRRLKCGESSPRLPQLHGDHSSSLAFRPSRRTAAGDLHDTPHYSTFRRRRPVCGSNTRRNDPGDSVSTTSNVGRT